MNWFDCLDIIGVSKFKPIVCTQKQYTFIQLKHLRNQVAHGVESLVSISPNSPYASDGNCLEQLAVALVKLQFEKTNLEKQIERWTILRRGDAAQNGATTHSFPTFEELLRAFNQKAAFSYTPPIGMLRLLLEGRYLANLIKRMFARRALILRKKSRSVARFCGVSWTRRLWFLMHGIRPPRLWQWTSRCPGFEYALSLA